MKTKLLLILVLISIKTTAQTPINTLEIENGNIFEIVNSTNTLDESSSGANLIWNFTDLVSLGQNVIYNFEPTTDEVTTYPNTSNVLVSTSDMNGVTNVSKLFTKTVGNTFSITGLNSTEIDLNFATNNASIGTLPMNYGYLNTDTLAGTYTFGTYSGTLTGTIASSVDAYGTMSTNFGLLSNTSVTRLKSVQNINLNYQIFSNVGTVVQTTYNYYPDQGIGIQTPLFRSTTTSINVPLLSINQTVTQYEVWVGQLLGTTSNDYKNFVSLYPNPVQDVLKIRNESDSTINSVSITDNNGRVVLNTTSFENGIDVSTLQNGIYFVKITTDKGTSNQKMIKN
ncbi:MAG: T9SS type A sorting domain-containing protein [Flavobacterium sp.]|uniref:T9SS type A sorting domain-containing protein n=1 Tax=Flavobacterium sp. TaxID=239 RepID=UPI0022BB4570|nr:T9SS type A sorting domain-containing protein [Flavobacterium sp.]MCZ8198245.1 T9SS type A sorting domain-containing protein [Flavobacterium sp.]